MAEERDKLSPEYESSLQAFLDMLVVEKGAANNTISAYRRDLREHLLFLQEQGVRATVEVEELHLILYLGHIRRRGRHQQR